MGEWQPIDSAPKMKTIILWADTSTPEFPNWKMATGYWSAGHDVWIWDGHAVPPWEIQPTHWMPLPAPPTEIEQ